MVKIRIRRFLPGPGGGPQVRSFSGLSQVRLDSFLAYRNDLTVGLYVAGGGHE